MEYKKSVYNSIISERIIGEKKQVLFFNAATGAIAWLDDDVKTAIIHGNIDKIKELPYFDSLIKNGFIVEKYIDEYERYMFKAKKFALDNESDNASFIIALTMACNYKCIYCFESENHGVCETSDEMLRSIFLFICNEVKKNNKKKLNINWFGGEPMLVFDKVVYLSKLLVDFCKDNEIEYVASLVTNGVFLDDRKLQILYKDCCVRHIQISIDGEKTEYTRMKNASEEDYLRVLDNIISISKSPIGLSLRLNACNENKESLLNFVNKLTNNTDFHGLIYAGKIMKYDKSDLYTEISDEDFYEFEKKINTAASMYKEFDKYAKKTLKPKGASCGYMVTGRGLIDGNGKIYRCEHHVGNEKLSVGDVNEGFYRNRIDYDYILGELPQKCRECEIMPVCMGGCASDRLLHNKMTDCKYIKKRISDYCMYISNRKN